jgi:hypothetical protein
MACDCEIPCRECKEGGSEYCTDPAECGHAVLPSSDNLLERAFMARIRAEEYQGETRCPTARSSMSRPRRDRPQTQHRALRGGAPPVY